MGAAHDSDRRPDDEVDGPVVDENPCAIGLEADGECADECPELGNDLFDRILALAIKLARSCGFHEVQLEGVRRLAIAEERLVGEPHIVENCRAATELAGGLELGERAAIIVVLVKREALFEVALALGAACEAGEYRTARGETVSLRAAIAAAGVAAIPNLSKVLPLFPERALDTGICESHAMDMCAGLAKSGLKPFFAVYNPPWTLGPFRHNEVWQRLH